MTSTLIENVGIGILIGMGIILVVAGFFGVFHTSLHIEELTRFFEPLLPLEALGILETSPFYILLADLEELRWCYVIFACIGVVTLVIGWILLCWKVYKEKPAEDTNE